MLARILQDEGGGGARLPALPKIDIPYDETNALAERSASQSLIPDDEIYPELGNIDAMREVYKGFMLGGDLETVAANHGIVRRTAFKWAARGKWLDRRRESLEAEAEYERQRLTELRIKERIPELESQIKAGRRLREVVEEKLKDADSLSPGQVMALGAALKSAGDNTVRALGVGESGATDTSAADKAKSAAPLVVVVKGGGLPPVRVREAGNQGGAGGVTDATVVDV